MLDFANERAAGEPSVAPADSGQVPAARAEDRPIARPGIIRRFLDHHFPRIHTWLARSVAVFDAPPEWSVLHNHLTTLHSAIENEITKRTYIEPLAKGLPESAERYRPRSSGARRSCGVRIPHHRACAASARAVRAGPGAAFTRSGHRFQLRGQLAGCHGNPITQVKMLWAAMAVPSLEVFRVAREPLASEVSWVRQQALIVSSAAAGEVGGSALQEDMLQSFASGKFLLRLWG